MWEILKIESLTPPFILIQNFHKLVSFKHKIAKVKRFTKWNLLYKNTCEVFHCVLAGDVIPPQWCFLSAWPSCQSRTPVWRGPPPAGLQCCAGTPTHWRPPAHWLGPGWPQPSPAGGCQWSCSCSLQLHAVGRLSCYILYITYIWFSKNIFITLILFVLSSYLSSGNWIIFKQKRNISNFIFVNKLSLLDPLQTIFQETLK